MFTLIIKLFFAVIPLIIGLIVYKKMPLFKEGCDIKNNERKSPKEEYSNPKNNQKGNSENFIKQNEKEKNSVGCENKQLKNENEIANYSEKSSTNLNEMAKIVEENIQKKFSDNFKIMKLDIIINRKQINILKRKNNMFLNAYKILYLRKISNIILDIFLKKNQSSLYKTDNIFKDDTKPDYKSKYFPIIIAKEKIKAIGINTINLLIDYLMFVKDYTSSIIHIVKKCEVQLEILFDLFAKEHIQKNSDVFSISISVLINTLFSRNISDNIDEKVLGNLIREEEEKKKEENSNNMINIINEVKNDNSNIVNNTIINTNIIEESNEKNNGNLPSENGQSTKEGSVQLDEINNIKYNNNGEINFEYENDVHFALNEKENEKREVSQKDNLIEIIDNIIDNFEKYYLNNNRNISINSITKQIKDIKINDLLERENEFSEIDISKLQKIKQLDELISKNKEIIGKNDVIDGEFIFSEWKKSFNVGYKATKDYQSLVIYEENINLHDIKDAVKVLIDEQQINIFCEDPGDFKNYKIQKIAKNEFKNYNLDFKKAKIIK